jgi:endonuclease YncB( thermonuclease family)
MRFRRKPIPGSIILPPRWRRHGAMLLTILAVAAVVVCERSGLTPLPAQRQSALPDSADRDDLDRYHDRTFRVVHVVDGDTLDIDAADHGKPKTRIRLWGVDTPEVAHGGQPDRYFCPEAKAFAEKTLDGKEVHIVLSPLRTRDKYGRLLAYVLLERGGTIFNEMLIEEGRAYADTRFHHSYEKRFEDAEKRARQSGVGLWANVKLEDMPVWRQRSEVRDKKKRGTQPATANAP